MNPEPMQKKPLVEKEPVRSLSNIDNRPHPVRRNSWFKNNQRNNNQMRQSQRKGSQIYPKQKKVNYKDVRQRHWLHRKLNKSALSNQPATPHNTTQFIVNTVHFPTDPYVYDFDSDRFSGDSGSHSMLGTMRDMLREFKQPTKIQEPTSKNPSPDKQAESTMKHEIKSNGLPEIKDIRNCFPDNAYELMKARSESDIFDGDRRFLSRQPSDSSPKPHHNYIDIKSLIAEAKNNHHNLETVIQSLVNKIKEKDDIITNLQTK